MTIILDNYTVPSNGKIDINLQLSYQLTLSADEAKRLVGRWARDEITLLLRTADPLFVIGESPIWRVPLEITFPVQNGVFPIISVDVDAHSGKIIAPQKNKQHILELLETKVKPFAPTHISVPN